MIFRHPLVPLFPQSRKSDPPFLSVKVNHCQCIETSQIRKTPKGPLYESKKENCLRFYPNFMFETLDHKDFKFLFFFFRKKNSFFLYFPNAWGPPKNFDVKNFLEKNVRSGFTGSWQIPKGTKSWILVNLVKEILIYME